MCGITGGVWFDESKAISSATLESMVQSLVHRGPDDAGTHLERLTRDAVGITPGVALGFRRLSIIDLVGGHQPISNEDDSVWMVFNGEIYNYRELHRRLEGAGHQFKSDSDSETILHLYEDLGVECFAHLNGMFAIAIWDRKQRQLVLARDRLGKKPLHYQFRDGQLLFGSELKALAAAPDFVRDISAGAIDQFLTYQYVPHPNSIYAASRKLAPGHYAVIRDNSITTDSYWKVDWSHEIEIGPREAAEKVDELLRDSIRLRLRSDVPLGAFLSGGIDSSLLVSLAQSQLEQPLHTFSIGFNEADFDETPYARQVAAWAKSEHHEYKVTPDAVSILDQLVWNYDEPFGDSSAIPTWYLCKWTREYVTVALSGDGGDELFAGYDRYRALWMSRWFDRLIPAGPLLGSSWVQGLPASNRQRSFIRRLQRFGEALNQPLARRYMNWLQIFPERMRAELYNDDFVAQLPDEDPFEFFEAAWNGVGDRDITSKASLGDLVTYLPCDLMNKVDIASMGNSLECRQPFLDYRLVEFAASLPSSLKMGYGGGKRLLRTAFDQLLPRQIWTRKKMGFGVPLGSWFQRELKDITVSRMLGDDSRLHQFFRPEAIAKLVDQHMQGKVNHCYRLWNLLVLESWLRRWN
ncbi:asparagine synthase (glutamine-hydrolyzing) [Aureliella helgolandensis]|uniref:asparagine synthase (glutamine-hydrolyzing) n=1 Tax=Aureliella helgolandensis TaxID=2527968 RepID=A0A518G106_9BACT|nr:asparagine synthase (glutamine-hydrolyzing) [Aureliella helgolandensis]QDV22287.1 Asparagine synthetase [glutamine-hydrolyzing] 1 [Aureliella helgolandensis]